MHPESKRLLIAACVLSVVAGLSLAGVAARVLDRVRLRKLSAWERRASTFATGAFVAMAVCWTWARFVEPRWIEVTRTTIETNDLPEGYRVRIVQISDVGATGASRALDRLPAVVNGLSPDLVVFTGNAMNATDGLAPFRAMLGAMHARLGVFAVRGNFDSSEWPDVDLFGGVARELVLDGVPLDEGRLTLCGAAYGNGALNLGRCLGANPGGYRIVAFNTPDWVEQLAEQQKPALYLAGHTRGGQIRVPFYGALVTGYARFGKKYEMGRYQVGDTVLYVNRGIGFEPRPFPQLRLLCRPEVSVIDLVGRGK